MHAMLIDWFKVPKYTVKFYKYSERGLLCDRSGVRVVLEKWRLNWHEWKAVTTIMKINIIHISCKKSGTYET